MKRFIALVLSLVMTLSLCAPAYAEGEATQLPDADANGVITLTGDVTLAKPFEVDAGETVTLNLGGKTLSYTSTEAKASCAIDNKGTLTITNGTVTYLGVGDASFGYGTNTINNSGELIIDGATIINTTDAGSSNAIDCAPGSELIVNDGEIKSEKVTIRVRDNATVTINGGDISGARAVQIHLFQNVNDATTLTINGGTFTGDYALYSYAYGACTFNQTTVNINGGTFNGIVAFGGGNKTATETVNIAGGTFNGELGRYLANDGWEDIAKPVYVASVAGKDYTSLQEAVNVGGNVTLLADVTLDATVVVNQNVVLDLNDKTITGQSGNNGFIFAVNDGASLTLKNGALVSSGYAVSSGGNGEKANTIVLDDVDISATSVGVYHNGSLYGADVTIKNGTTINVANGAGIFLSGSAIWASADKMNKLTITDSTVKGGTAVEVKHGNVTVTNSTLTATEAVAERNYNSGNCTVGYALALTNNGMENAAEASTGTVQINSGNFTGKIGIKDDDSTALVGNTDGAKIVISGGYFTVDPSAYCADKLTGVTSDKAGYLYMVGEKGVDKPADVVVAAPEVTVDTTNMSTTEKNIADALTTTENAVKLDESALTAKAADIANNTSAEATDDHAKALDEAIATNNTPIAKDDVTIVVQPYFDVEIKDVVVEESGATVSSVTIKLDITPMYQTVATTADLDNGDNIVTDKDDANHNAVVVDKGELTITEPVEIKIAIPAALAIDDGEGGYKPLYVTHTKDNGTKYVYEAKVESDGNGGFTATFTNPNGFSLFTLSVENTTAAKVGNDSYADLQSAIDNAGKDATITVVKNGNHKATVKGETSFKLVLENGATATITAAPGYKVSGPDADGVYTVTKVTGGYYPYYPPTTTPDSELVKSPDTFDAGIALYVGVSVMGAIGTVVLGKKRED